MPEVPAAIRAIHSNRNKKALNRAAHQLCFHGKYRFALMYWNEDNDNTNQSKVKAVFSASMFENSEQTFLTKGMLKLFHASKRAGEKASKEKLRVQIRTDISDRMVSPLDVTKILG